MNQSRIYSEGSTRSRRDPPATPTASASSRVERAKSSPYGVGGSPRLNSMSAHQASLIVGANRSRSSSIQTRPRDENSLVVGRHLDRSVDFDRASNASFMKQPRRSVSHNDSIDTNTDPTVPVQLTVWFHELRTSNKDFLIDISAVPGIKVGDTIEIEAPERTDPKSNTTTAPKKVLFTVTENNVLSNASTAQTSGPASAAMNTTAPTPGTPVLNPQPSSTSQPQPKAKNALQLSLVANPLQKILDLLPRTAVAVRKIVDLEAVEAETIEISIKNINLTRDSMWMLSSEMQNTCVFTGMRVSFLESRIGSIKTIYKKGRRTFSGYVGPNTKFVYRSESAKLMIFIQMSKEMWHFEETGEIMFHKLVNTLFPKIFRKWRDKDANHTITIILFASVDLTDIPWTALAQGERPNKTREYFRVVVDQVSIFHWSRIMENLRLEFANFKRDILLSRASTNNSSNAYLLDGYTLPAVKGNFLEAVNMGMAMVKDRFTDTDLRHSLSHFVVITPGTGLFDVDYNLLLETSRKIASSDCALDIICMSQPPLHLVPLFRYKDLSKNGKLSHCVPNWCDISFYEDPSLSKDQWIPRCKIYELQMMGLMENEVSDIEIERLRVFKNPKSFHEFMTSYDNNVFRTGIAMHDKSEISSSFTLKRPDEPAFFKNPTPKGVHDSLLLMLTKKDLRHKASVSKFDIGTTTSVAVGTVSSLIHPDSTALTSLYQLKETDDVKSPALKSKARAIKSFAGSDLNIRPASIVINKTKSPMDGRISPKVIKSDEIFKPIDSSRFNNRNARELSDLSLQRSSQLSTVSLDAETNTVFTSYWSEISNPSKEEHTDALAYIRLGKWNEVFPPKIKRNIVKWRSFQSPAALPIFQSSFPTSKELDTKYTTQIYNLFLNSENELDLRTTDDLVREMIALRLMLGYQIAHGDKVKLLNSEQNQVTSADSIVRFHPKGSYFGTKTYLILDDEIHRITCDFNGGISVQLYRRIEEPLFTPLFKTLGFDPAKHKPLIRTRYAEDYTVSETNFIQQKPAKYNWNQFDQLLAGYDDALPEENKSFFKMKFVVMPTDIPKNAFFISNESLSDEEIRVEGLRKLITMIEKGEYMTDDEKPKKEVVPEISFYTGNLYEFLSQQAEAYEVSGNTSALMVPEKARFNKTIKLAILAHEIQSPTGVKIVDRQWHFTTHQHCFVGDEFVTWLVDNFADIETREEAVTYGQSLMEKGLFKHVANRHGFLDGYYYYELEQDYIDRTSTKIERSSWFVRKKDSASASKNNSDVDSAKSPSLPAVEPSHLHHITNVAQLNEADVSSFTDSAGSKTKSKRKFILSRAVRYNADPLKKSSRPEILTVHYDIVHNPEHCYHVRLQWLNTSNRFIEETISNWSRVCERHGLKFVETPWKELCSIPQYNPFHSHVDLKLAKNPWEDPEFNLPNILENNKFYYHLHLLRKSGFLLDNRSAIYFAKESIQISYSWGDPSFKYAQFIHKSGSYIVEIRDNGDFFLAPNNMHIARLNAPVTSNFADFDSNINLYIIDSQRVMLGLRKTCNSKELLTEIFREAKSAWRDEYLNFLPTDI